MVDSYGRWYPDYAGQQPFQDPSYMRMLNSQQMRLQQSVPVMQQQIQQQAQQATPQIQPVQQQVQQNPTSGGFVSVRSEQDARAWPVAPGSSVTFIDEYAPYCYTKTMGLSQLDRPQFVKYRLVKEEDFVQQQQIQPAENNEHMQSHEYVSLDVFEAAKSEIDELKSAVENLKSDLYGDSKQQKTEKKNVRKEAI